MRSIMHIDANSAYLSWTAVDLLEHGCSVDARTVPAVIAGDPANRHGIILAKSIPAKQYKIHTGESLCDAKQKCPGLLILPADYDLYLGCSDAMYDILSEYSDVIERYSVDECWLDYTASRRRFGDPVETAYAIKERIKSELGFTVNVGVSVNKLLAKMGSELQKPDRVHTLFEHEIEEKMWPLDVSELFFVGRATTRKLKNVGINTIGQIAKTDPLLLKALLKPAHGKLVYDYARGVDDSEVRPNNLIVQKGVGNSTTIAFDVDNRTEACQVLLALSERVGYRLRKMRAYGQVISVTIRNSELFFYRRQTKLHHLIGTTTEIYENACKVFDALWRGDLIRGLGVHLTDLYAENNRQLTMLDRDDEEKLRKIDRTVDKIRNAYGDGAIMRGVYANGELAPIQGGVNNGDYLLMGGYSL
jgi:DNA polymerase-4